METPTDLEAEEAVVGCAIVSDRGYRLAASRVSAAAFYRGIHADLFRACGKPEVAAIDGMAPEALDSLYRPDGCDSCAMFAAKADAESLVREALCDRCGPLIVFGRSTVARMLRVADLAVVDLADVLRLVQSRPVYADVAGTYAARVLAASRKREAMRSLAEAYNALGEGRPLETVLPALTQLGAT